MPLMSTYDEAYAGRLTRGFPARWSCPCFKCGQTINVGDIVLRSNNLARSPERGLHKTGPDLIHVYCAR